MCVAPTSDVVCVVIVYDLGNSKMVIILFISRCTRDACHGIPHANDII